MGVQDRTESQVHAEMPVILAKVLDRLARRGEHGVVDVTLVTPSQGAKLSRESESDKEILDRQELLALPVEPFGRIVVLTFGAAPVAARARMPLELSAVRATAQDLSGFRGPASGDGIHRSSVARQEPAGVLSFEIYAELRD